MSEIAGQELLDFFERRRRREANPVPTIVARSAKRITHTPIVV